MNKLKLPFILTRGDFEMDTAMGVTTFSASECKSTIMIKGRPFVGTFFVTPYSEFHLVLGMDWLEKYKVVLHCVPRQIQLTYLPEEPELIVIEEDSDV